MRVLKAAVAPIVCLCVLGIATPAQAVFHLWNIQEVFSNSDGTVQFIELFTPSVSQQFTNGQKIQTTTESHTFTFPSNTPSPTNGHTLLLATADFDLLTGGVTADFTIPANFFDPDGDTINFIGTDTGGSVTFASVPTDGVMSLNYPGDTTGTNSPKNYDGDMGELDLSSSGPTGDYNGDGFVNAADYTVWRNTKGDSVGSPGDGADGDESGTVDDGDYTFWRDHYGDVVLGSGAGGGASSIIPEPATLGLVLVGLTMLVAAATARLRPAAES